MKLAGEDGVVTYDEIRENLRKLNFSDLEIEIFCARYDKDGDYRFSAEEINAIERNLGEQIENLDHLILDHEKKVAEEEAKPLNNVPKMNRMQFAVLTKRVDDMEKQMGYVAEKVDRVLNKMGPAQGSREGSAISRGARDIASARREDNFQFPCPKFCLI